MRILLLLLLFAGIVLVILNEKLTCNVPRVEYRYLPRDLDTYLRESKYPSVVFEGEDPWFLRQ
jgi:hypothetical protein